MSDHISSTSPKKWDVFISHASEDKEAVALPLTDSLRRAGLRVWLDAHVLSLGDSLREKIEAGLASSRFGIVIISPHFLSKRWPTREINGLTALEDDGEKVILPIWHNISKSEIMKHSPILADRLASDTTKGIPAVAAEVLDVVLSRSANSPSVSSPSLTRRLIDVIEKGPTAEELADFLCSHRQILRSAFNYADVGQLAYDAQKGYAFFGARAYTPRIIGLYGVAFAPSNGAMFVDGNPSDALKHIIDNVKATNPGELAFAFESGWSNHYHNTVILAGRRDDYGETERTLLQRLNESLREDDIEVRSYDWLIEACLNVDPQEK